MAPEMGCFLAGEWNAKSKNPVARAQRAGDRVDAQRLARVVLALNASPGDPFK